ncbi:MAG: cation:proton antiporter [Flavobacteriales bacterium]|nr:cation:proton antiporter [Flavobacteriales bacterium]
MKFIHPIILLFSLLLLSNANGLLASEETHSQHTETTVSHGAGTEHEQGEAHEEHHTDTSPLFFIVIAVILGAATRFLFQKSIIPFTVILLLLGIGLGVIGRLDYFHVFEIGSSSFDFRFLDQSIDWAAHIDPHLLLYIFLPILIFEAAFGMDLHVFKKTFANATIMAVPGIIAAIVLTALCVLAMNYFGIGIPKWNWTLSLLFGAVISATDPVAVVSILKELGASKKLGTLIEGESLLNDGTAIVIFMVIFLGITGTGSDSSPILEFFKVSFGGVGIGLVIGYFVIRWIKKVFNDALVEISAIIAAAYITFFIAEHFLHVSGVLALVAFGLMMAGSGRTKISPEVQHFLHEFWELAAFIANTLIFLIVGVVIAERTVFTMNDLLILFLIYIAISVVRAIVIALFYPAMKRIGYGLNKKDAVILWYGALRGAIGLALALIVAGTSEIDSEIRHQFLFFTAGIVTLTLLINATTIKALVNYLGLTRLSPAKILTLNNANSFIQQSAEKNIERLKSDRYLKRANWRNVKKFMPEYEIQELSVDVEKAMVVAESRTRILEKEKSSYWHQFTEGLLSPQAYRILTEDINNILDSKGALSLSNREDIEKMLKNRTFLSKAQNFPVIGRFAKRMFFEQLIVTYDCAKGFVAAQDDCLKLLESMYRSAESEEENKNLKLIEEEIMANRIEGLTFLRNLGREYPEIYGAIATKEAIRTMLNFEKHTVERLLKRGRVAKGEADNLIQNIEHKMKELRDTPPLFELPDAGDLLAEVPWLKDVDHASFHKIAKQFESKIFNTDDVLFTEGKEADGMYIIIRGNIRVSINNEVIDILGPGNTIGEVAALNDNRRTATVTAESPLTTLWISSKGLMGLIEAYPEIDKTIWNSTAVRYAYNLLKDLPPYDKFSHNQFEKALENGQVTVLSASTNLKLTGQVAVLINGSATLNGEEILAPAVIRDNNYLVKSGSRIFSTEKLS